MPSLIIDLKIPFECDPPVNLVPALTFTHWIPIGHEQGISVDDEDIQFVLWFDEKCAWFGSQPTADELKNCVNVLARYVNVEIRVTGLPDDVLTYMQSAAHTESVDEVAAALQSKYESIAQKVLRAVLHRVNRLISFARSYKGQYWITEHQIDQYRLRHYFIKFSAQGRVDDGPRFIFAPPTVDRIIVTAGDKGRYIQEADWIPCREFVGGAKKPDFAGELLAGAEYLLKAGHRRSALTEAVTALEIAVFRFSRSPRAEARFSSDMADRLGLSTLASQVSHLGLSASVKYLLPTILSEEILPASILSLCQDALTQRQNVVHNGQRDVNEDFVRRAIAAIRAFCDILDSVTEEVESEDVDASQ